MATPLHQDGRFGPIILVLPRHSLSQSLYQARNISGHVFDFETFQDFSIGIWKCSDEVVFSDFRLHVMEEEKLGQS